MENNSESCLITHYCLMKYKMMEDLIIEQNGFGEGLALRWVPVGTKFRINVEFDGKETVQANNKAFYANHRLLNVNLCHSRSCCSEKMNGLIRILLRRVTTTNATITNSSHHLFIVSISVRLYLLFY